ncbi:MAG: putative fructokinase, partial [Pseudomonadota bacterium]
MRGSNHSGMRQFNERIVLQAIRHHGAIPKADLARLTQLSTQTVAIIVGRLLDDDLLIKQERIRGKIGQPSVPLSLNPEGAYSIGVQVGRRNLELLVADFCGQPVLRHEVHYDYPDPQVLMTQIAEGLHALQVQLGERWERVVGVGLTAPLSVHKWADLMQGDAAQALR